MGIQDTRQQIEEYIRSQGATLIGVAPVTRWAEYKEVEPDYRPESIWPRAKSVIVLGVPVLLPILETTPSIHYTELYETSNRLLDQLAYRLSVHLNEQGHSAIFLPRDGYGDIRVLVEKPLAAFSHVFAAKYAGLGTIGFNHTLINSRYGPRARYVSVFTSLELPGDPVQEKDLCINCRLCQKVCPTQAFTPREDRLIADMDKKACAGYHSVLRDEHRYPCGVCIKVCPVGEDRELYQSKENRRYLKEREALDKNSEDPEYRSWVHIRRHGSNGDRIY
ncbi:MAG TPA: 4Fe-4S dicluster domain-containing protein [Patescibacteria group bacterium]|nr:4Fe-4S dicluster domain-containing protein [Patescibacteria group bacterium]